MSRIRKSVTWIVGLICLLFFVLGSTIFWVEIGRWQFSGAIANHFLDERSGKMPIFKVELDEFVLDKSAEQAEKMLEASGFQCANESGALTCQRNKGGLIVVCREDWTAELKLSSGNKVIGTRGTVSVTCL